MNQEHPNDSPVWQKVSTERIIRQVGNPANLTTYAIILFFVTDCMQAQWLLDNNAVRFDVYSTEQ